jgi:hypothetical protein
LPGGEEDIKLDQNGGGLGNRGREALEVRRRDGNIKVKATKEKKRSLKKGKREKGRKKRKNEETKKKVDIGK